MNFDLWTTHSLDKIFPESQKPGGAAESIHLKAARTKPRTRRSPSASPAAWKSPRPHSVYQT